MPISDVLSGLRTRKGVPDASPSIHLAAGAPLAATAANTTETDLATYTLPAGAINQAGAGLRVTAWGKTAANANTKRARIYFGATAVADTGAVAMNNVAWVATAIIARTAADAQVALGQMRHAATDIANLATAPAEALTGAVVVKVTGLNGTANANDLTIEGFLVEAI